MKKEIVYCIIFILTLAFILRGAGVLITERQDERLTGLVKIFDDEDYSEYESSEINDSEIYEPEAIEPDIEEELILEELKPAELEHSQTEVELTTEPVELNEDDLKEELLLEEYGLTELEPAAELVELNEDLQQPTFTGYTLPNGAERDLYASIYRKCHCDEIGCVECQLERLSELLKWELNEFDLDGEPLNIPRVSLILRPTALEKHFSIGVLDEPTPECIDFILAHTGIPRERARIFKSIPVRGNNLPPKYPEDDVPFFQDKYTESLQETVPLSTTIRIGELLSIEGTTGRATVGHPINSLGDSFATALHGDGKALEGRSVYRYGTNTYLGYVGQSYFEPHRDVAIVHLVDNRIHPFVDGGQIDSYKEDISVGQSVISVRGVSGTQRSLKVHLREARGRFEGENFDFVNKIAIRPTGEAAKGDSGAALISRSAPNDRAILGTFAGVAPLGDGELAAIYTSVMNYSSFIIGDLDGDGRVTSADATALARWLVGHKIEVALCASNITCKPGTLPGPNMADLTRLSRWLVGQVSRCPNGLFCAVCVKEILF